MKIVKPLRFLFIYGNLLLLFKNLSLISRRNRYFIYCVILLELFLSITNCVAYVYYKIYIRYADIIYNFVLFINSTIFVLFSCYHAENLKKMLTFLESNNEFVQKDIMYLKDFARKKILIIVIVITHCGLKILMPILYSKFFNWNPKIPFFIFFILKLNSLAWDFRCVYEYSLMFALLYLFSEQLECIIRSIVKHKHFVSSNYKLKDANWPNEFVCNQYIEKMSEWFYAVTLVTEAIKLFNTVFGFQLAVMLTSGTFYVTLFLYDTAAVSIKNEYDNILLLTFILRLVVTQLLVFVLSKAGQRLFDNVEHLRRLIGKIYILSLADDKFYDATKDMLMYMSCGQARVLAFGSVEVNMQLPPTLIMLFTSYTILALQFNNVL
nr:gustatory receptor 36 [Papilio dardanus]